MPRIALILALLCGLAARASQDDSTTLPIRLTWGYRSRRSAPFFVRLTGNNVHLTGLQLEQAEPEDRLTGTTATTRAGAGDVDGLSGTLEFAEASVRSLTNAHSTWRYLLEHTDPGAAARLELDPAWRADARRLTVELNESGTRGFTLTVDQLQRQKTFWFPELDLFISTDPAVALNSYLQTLGNQGGQRILDRVQQQPEATYAEEAARWEDMGSPAYQNPHSTPPGQIVGLTWDSALSKFGMDRFAEVRNDYAKTDVFHLRIPIPNARAAWRGQQLWRGLPLITTIFENEGVRYEIEQFAYPLLGPPAGRQGEMDLVLFEKVSLTELDGKARDVSLPIELAREPGGEAELENEAGASVLASGPDVWLSMQAKDVQFSLPGSGGKTKEVIAHAHLPTNGRREWVMKLPSPRLPPELRTRLLALDYEVSRAATVKFWEDSLAKGASFQVPDEAVNTLFRANLWHALRLPRRHPSETGPVQIDLPYSNFAYDQKGTPWPVNQCVYVDYMLYDLRGYHAISAEELGVMFRNNQEENGHVGGFANWGVYTPSMIFSAAQHYLLSGDRESFEQLLPATLKALDWCLGEIKHTSPDGKAAQGLMLAPLNDLTHEPRAWAFNQAYFYAGFDFLARALSRIGHPRAVECREAARALRVAVEREFGRASVRSAAVELADGSWTSYVPTDAQGSGRLLQAWYPTDVDVGPLHLARLKAVDPSGWLATAMLNDHEDNLFIHQWGAMNEPVYNPQGTAYLFRDEPKAAIRTFYTTMACAFSHSVFEPVEHRWGWGQFFGPPSTDGAWFELYRNMLVREMDEDSLLLGQAVPRAWLKPGRKVEVKRAPTYFGPISYTIQGGSDELKAAVELSGRQWPSNLLVRFRHPEEKPIRAVFVNGRPWKDIDPAKEWVRIPSPRAAKFQIVAHY